MSELLMAFSGIVMLAAISFRLMSIADALQRIANKMEEK